MVAIAARNAEAFARNPPAPIFIFLVHGADSGLVRSRARTIALSRTPNLSDPFAVVRLSADDIVKDPALLLDEAGTIGLWAAARTIWIDAATRSTIPGVEQLLADPPAKVSILIEAGELKRDAPLRRACEGDPKAAAIDCPFDALEDKGRLIQEWSDAEKLGLDEDVGALLLSLLGADRLSSLSELEKLALYAKGQDRVTADDVQQAIAGGFSVAPDMVATAALNGKHSDLAKIWDQAQASGIDGQVILGFALRKLLLSHSGVYRISPTLTAEATRQAIRVVSAAIKACRRTPSLSDSLAIRALWSVVRLCRQNRTN